eukprot:Opistho-2@67810
MPLQRHQQVVHGAGAVGHRDDQAGAVAGRGRRRGHGLRQADDGEARAVVGLVLDRMGHDVQAEQAGGALAGDGGPGRVGGRQAGTFGIAGDRTALGVRQVLIQPVLALGQGLRVGQHGLDALQRVAVAQQVVAYQQADLADHMGPMYSALI